MIDPTLSDKTFDKRWFEDFVVGELMEYGQVEVTEELILSFGRDYDPEPYHTDTEAAKNSIFGGLIASGLQVAALSRRMNVEAFPNLSSEGSPGWEEVRWRKPVRPGDILHTRTRVIETRPLSSRPELGLARFEHAVVDAEGEEKMTAIATVFYRRRPEA